MNLITNDCYSLTGTHTDNDGKIVTWTNVPSPASKLGTSRSGWDTPSSINMSYQFRIICVVGTSCWSLMVFISNAQVLKPLFVLLVFVLPYTLMCFLWWFTYSWRQIYSEAGEACTNADKINARNGYEDYA